MLGIDASQWTLSQLRKAYEGRMVSEWDHTVAMLNVWSKKPIRNPFRRRQSTPMTPAELHAMQRAIERRNQKRGG